MSTHTAGILRPALFILFAFGIFLVPSGLIDASSCGYTGNIYPTVSPNYPPVCTITASDTSIQKGESVTLSWTSSPSSIIDYAWINQGICNVPKSGSKTVSPTETTTYIFKVFNDELNSGQYGLGSCQVTVTVNDPEPDPEPAVCDTFYASPSTREGAGYVTLHWNTSLADSVSINNGVGSVSRDGSKSVYVYDDTMFTLTATNQDGSDSCTTHVTVTDPDPEPPVCDAFNITPSSREGAGYVTFSWNTTNATHVSINNGVGTVANDGTKNVYVTQSGTYTLTATNADGSDTCTDTVTILTPDPEYPKCDAFYATPSSREGAGYVTLFWNTTDATKVHINNGVGDVANDGSRNVYVSGDTTFTLTASNADGFDTCTTFVDIIPPEPELPVCDAFNITPESRTGPGYVTFSWNTTNADDVYINNGVGTVANDGVKSVYVTESRTYTLTATNADGSDTCSDTIEILPEEPDYPKCDSFTASDYSIDEGDYVTLSWNTTNADEVEINPLVGDVADDGSRSLRLYNDTHFNLTARNDEGTDTCSLFISVDEEEEEEDAVCEWFEVSDDDVDEGDYVTLYWETSNADDVEINNGVGDVDDDGDERVRVWDDTTFRLTARNDFSSDSCTVRVNVDEDHDDEDVECDSFEVSDSRVDEGDYVTLRWRTTNADDVYINNGIGDVDDDGSERVRVWDDTTFRLTARGDGDTDTCTVRVRVDEDDEDVRCDWFRVDDDDVDEGDYVTLSWRTTNADDVDINNGIGDVRDDGSERVRVYRDTTFRLTARGDGDTDTCTVRVNVDDDGEVAGITYSDTRYLGGISFSQIPYTGFEAGPMLTFIFYLAIALWSAVIAYALVLKKRREAAAMAAISPAQAFVEPTLLPVNEDVVDAAPDNLPTEEDISAEETSVTEDEDSITALEDHAHTHYALISSDALQYIKNKGKSLADSIAELDRFIRTARERYPKDGDWIVLNKERILSLEE